MNELEGLLKLAHINAGIGLTIGYIKGLVIRCTHSKEGNRNQLWFTMADSCPAESTRAQVWHRRLEQIEPILKERGLAASIEILVPDLGFLKHLYIELSPPSPLDLWEIIDYLSTTCLASIELCGEAPEPIRRQPRRRRE